MRVSITDKHNHAVGNVRKYSLVSLNILNCKMSQYSFEFVL